MRIPAIVRFKFNPKKELVEQQLGIFLTCNNWISFHMVIRRFSKICFH